VESALHSFLLSVPQAAAIWMTMLLTVAVTAAALVRPGPPAPASSPEDEDAARYAEEIAVAADRAAITAERRRAEWMAAREEVDAAWAAYEEADRVARRATAASAFPVFTRCRPAEAAERERFLHRAATAACRRQEISVHQLNEALAHRGWNPRLHPVAQEAALRTAMREHRLTAYRAATAREQETWREAEAAAAALRSLRAEAMDAPLRIGRKTGAQWWAEQWTSTQPLPALSLPSTVDTRHPIAA
jgi:hypothetical protein